MSDRIEQLEKKIADAKSRISSNLVSGGDPSQRGASLFNTILGSRVGGFLSNVPASVTEARRRQAEGELKRAESQLEREKKKDRTGTTRTPSEAAEESRESDIRETEIVAKEDEVVDHLRAIRSNTDALVGNPSIVAIGGMGRGRAGAAGAAGADGIMGSGLDAMDLGLLGTMILPGPLKALAKSRVGQFVTGFFTTAKVAQTGQMGFAGIQAARMAQTAKQGRMASAVTGLSKAARTISMGRFFGGLVSFGITEAIYQIGNAMIEEANDEIRANEVLLNVSGMMDKDDQGRTRSTNAGMQRDAFGNTIPGTGMILRDPARGDAPGEMPKHTIARGLLRENEHLVYERLRAAHQAFERNEDGIGVEQMEAAQTLLRDRGRIASMLSPSSLEEALGILRFEGTNIFGAATMELNGVGDEINSLLEPHDYSKFRQTLSLLEQFDPQSNKGIKNLQQAQVGRTTTQFTGQSAIDKGLNAIGFEGLRRTDTGTETIISDRLEFGLRQKRERISGSASSVSVAPTSRSVSGMLSIDRNASGTFDRTMLSSGTGVRDVGLYNVNAPTISQQNTTNYVADGYGDESFMDRDRANLFTDANYDLRNA